VSLEAWELVRARDIPSNTKVVDFKFVFKTKTDEHGKETKKKARLVARGFMEDTTGQLTFAPVSAYSTVLAVSAAQDHVLEYADIKSAYLLAELPEDHHVYMHVPPGIKDTDADGSKLLCKLKKGLYGLAASGRLWSNKLCSFMLEQGFQRSHSDPALYIRAAGTRDVFYVTSWVDDLIFSCRQQAVMDEFKAALAAQFEMSAQGTCTSTAT